MPPKRKAKARSAITLGVGAISAAADLASGGTGIISGVAQASLLVFDKLWDRQQARGIRMLRAALDAADNEFPRVLQGQLQNQDVRDAILEAMRTALEALSDEVMPALGGLIREYRKDGRPPDGFFRGCCRLLQDVSPGEYRSLVGLVEAIAKSPLDDAAPPHIWVSRGETEDLRRVRDAPDPGPFVIVDASRYFPGGVPPFAAPGCDPEDTARLFHLLEREGFGRRHDEGRSGSFSYFKLPAQTARRIARLVRSGREAA